jgi:hypothetical protein
MSAADRMPSASFWLKRKRMGHTTQETGTLNLYQCASTAQNIFWGIGLCLSCFWSRFAVVEVLVLIEPPH